MNCARHRQAIQELLDGALGPIHRAELEAHVAVCASCRALLQDLQQIHGTAATLAELPPPPGVWLQIAGRLRQEGRAVPPPPVVRARSSRTAILAIAAGLVAVVGASLVSLLPYLTNGGPTQAPADPAVASATEAPGGAPPQSIEDHFRIAEQHMQAGIGKLEEAAKADESVIDAQTAAMLRKNLEMIDQAIAESRAALKAEPQSTIARDSLFNALRRKLALLQDTVALMNEMRKGDAAGAAQLIEGVNKS